MSIFVRMKRSVAALALIAGAMVHVTAPARADGTTLGDITGFSTDRTTYALSAGAAKVRVVFLQDDVFRLWPAPDGNFTDPASTSPEDPNAPASTIVTKPTTARRARPGATAARTTC